MHEEDYLRFMVMSHMCCVMTCAEGRIETQQNIPIMILEDGAQVEFF